MGNFLRKVMFILFIFTSCTVPIRRMASVNEEEILNKAAVIEFKYFPSNHEKVDLKNFVSETNTQYSNLSFNSTETKAIEVEIIQKDLKEGVSYTIEASVKENGIHKILIVKNSKLNGEDEFAKAQIIKFIKLVNNEKYYPNTYSFFEAMYNAKFGDFDSIKLLKKLQLLTTGSENIEEEVAMRTQLMEEIAQLDEKIIIQKRERRKLEASRKDIMASLDKASDDGQLKTLLQKNDRNGVAELLEKYLPREQMTPMEHRFWDQILYKIKNPTALKDRVLVFRGTLGDRLYPAIENGKEIPYDQAVKEGKLAAMSTVITRNQGTWNRRLRSLQTIYDKKLTQNPNNIESEFTQSARITTWMKQHSIEAQGSPFLSYTSNFNTGRQFGFNVGKGNAADKNGAKSMGAFLIDPEILVFNQMTNFKSEMEYLHSLISFPDEMVSFVDESVNGELQAEEVEKLIYNGFHEKIKAKYGEVEAVDIISKIEKRSKDFNDRALAYIHPQFKSVKKEIKVPGEPGFLKKLWGSFTGKPVESFKTEISYVNEIETMPKLNNCLYIIKSFYK